MWFWSERRFRPALAPLRRQQAGFVSHANLQIHTPALMRCTHMSGGCFGRSGPSGLSPLRLVQNGETTMENQHENGSQRMIPDAIQLEIERDRFQNQAARLRTRNAHLVELVRDLESV